ncbi:MAG: tRNA (guanosine(37)-N1)-methyltransferase TrmD [Thermomicrobiales bacterium]
MAKDLTDAPGTASAAAPALRFDVFTLFPGIFAGPLEESILRRAQERRQVAISVHDIRSWTTDRHRTADDTPYGGGAGMVMTAPPIVTGVESVLGEDLRTASVLAMSAGGVLFDQAMARDLATSSHIALICGRYEGIDERAITLLDAAPVSIGDYVLTGGELAALVIIDAVTRLVPGVIDAASIAEESHEEGLVEYPHYTRPPSFRGLGVPDVLLSGHHAEIARWRREQSIHRTALLRPDLLNYANLSPREREIVERDSAGGDR